ncbi:MAG: aconitate hydratase AcnA [Promethearchaeota archaeon]
MEERAIQQKIKETIKIGNELVSFYNLRKIEDIGMENIEKFPYSLRILLENIIRNLDGNQITSEHVFTISKWNSESTEEKEIPFIPTRILLQDFTGIPVMVDLAALRSAMTRWNGDPSKINPCIPVDLIIDHSIQVDFHGSKEALEKNEKMEMERNKERYVFLKWAQNAFENFRLIPTSKGICHQINLEYLAKIVHLKKIGEELFAFPDTLLGTDSHTTMINSLGIVGWGVGGIEAEAVMLNQPYYMLVPKVVGVKLIGKLQDNITATDVVLNVTRILRNYVVVGKIVEFFGPGLKELTLEDRATIANMAPEYGATMGFFPVDEETIRYLKKTGRKINHVNAIEVVLKKMGLFRDKDTSLPDYNEILEIDLSDIHLSMAGPKRPQERVLLRDMKQEFINHLKTTFNKSNEIKNVSNGKEFGQGAVVIAAITSCTNTSNPHVMIGAGLLAKKAVEKGLKIKNHVKTSLAPGSRIVTTYLKKSGLMKYLEELGFYVVAYGCTTCIGNSGPINENIIQEIKEKDLIVAAVLSGNRNFEGRINPYVKANYLASPPLVIAYAIAGTIAINLEEEPLGKDKKGKPIYLRDIWPNKKEILEIMNSYITNEIFQEEYTNIFQGWKTWNELILPLTNIYQWEDNSTYIREPPFFQDFSLRTPPLENIVNARVLAVLGDSITTDHISPAGAIPKESLAGQYLISKGIKPEDFNSYGSRRGNHEVMMRGTFANIRLKNHLVSREGGWTKYHLTGEIMPIYEAAMNYQKQNIPLIILAGKDYGMGSSRDWAAKGTQLLGIKAIIAESYERIHRSNLIGMGVLPLQFKQGENIQTLNLDGTEIYDILGLTNLTPGKELTVHAHSEIGKTLTFSVKTRLDTPIELDYYRNKGILPSILRTKLKEK